MEPPLSRRASTCWGFHAFLSLQSLSFPLELKKENKQNIIRRKAGTEKKGEGKQWLYLYVKRERKLQYSLRDRDLKMNIHQKRLSDKQSFSVTCQLVHKQWLGMLPSRVAHHQMHRQANCDIRFQEKQRLYWEVHQQGDRRQGSTLSPRTDGFCYI